MRTRTTDPRPAQAPTWDQYWQEVGNEDYLIARRLIELSSSVRRHFEAHLTWHEDPVLVDDPDDPPFSMPDPSGAVWRGAKLDWRGAAASGDEWACSSTERRLLDLVLSLIQPDLERDYDTEEETGRRLIDVRDLSNLGSWQHDVALILAEYMGLNLANLR